MKKEDALALSEQAVSELAVALAAGKSDKLKHYLKMMGIRAPAFVRIPGSNLEPMLVVTNKQLHAVAEVKGGR